MARMHARRRGQSGSKKPYLTEAPEWAPLPSNDVEELVVKLSKGGMSTALIGITLRDQYGVPGVKLITGKSITSILSENGVRFRLPEDLQNLMKKAIALDDHLTNNTKDLHNRRGLQLVEAKVRRLVKYYKRTGVLPQNWNYSLKNARLLIE